MHQGKRAVLAIILLVIVLSVLAFVLENQQSVSLSFLGWLLPQMSVSLAVMLALLVGIMIGPLAAWFYGALRKGAR